EANHMVANPVNQAYNKVFIFICSRIIVFVLESTSLFPQSYGLFSKLATILQSNAKTDTKMGDEVIAHRPLEYLLFGDYSSALGASSSA
ncbi:MAG: hypothetical protein IK053_00515, partial [Muribaculaceae bacterium]|nr:hypothetical protein [Muribaculaceae bacterium]